ncbi:MAG: MFS transporter [Alphaproteobacteria bacterium]|nr:MFS transporter [Alphaproteobacteria bacterium]
MAGPQWTLVWMCVLVAVNQIGFGSVVPALPLYAQSFGVPVSAIGLAVGVYGLARFAGSPPAGYLSDRFGRRNALALGGIVTAIGNLWCAVATSYPEFILARFVAGAGAGLIVTTGQIVLADITTVERRGRTVSIYQGVFIFAAGIGPLPGGLLSEHFGLNAPFVAYSIAGIIAGLVAWCAVPETRDPAHVTRRGRGERAMPLLAQLRRLAGLRGFVLACFVSLANAVARTGGLFAVVPLLGSLRLGLSISEIGFALALGTVIGFLAAYPGGMLVDYFGRKAVIAPSTILAGVAMLLFCVAPTFAWFIAASVIWGTASSIGGAAPSVYAADCAPPGLNASTVSIFRMAGDIGYITGPVALGVISDQFGAVTALIAAAGLLVIAGGLFAAFAPETYRARGN